MKMSDRYELAQVYKGRVDSTTDKLAFRWHQVIKRIDLRKPIEMPKGKAICFLGFCCDEGVRRNMGRTGAANGPNSIRKEFANWPASFVPHALLYDAGNITCTDGDMEAAQEALSNAVAILMDKGFFPILLGGGHEIALGHYNGIVKATDQAPAIINFDAHLDLRPVIDQGSSGTMFNQIHQSCEANNRDFNYLCIGLQTYANTPSLFAKADEIGASYILAKDIAISPAKIEEQIQEYISDKQQVYLTLCTDVLSAAHAPGVSAVQPFGLDPEIVLHYIKSILKSGKVCSIDMAEVSPRFDADNRTAKLGAVYIYAIVNTLIEL